MSDRTPPKPHAIWIAHQAMVVTLGNILPPRLHVEPDPAEYEDQADYVMAVMKVWDDWFLTYGHIIREHSHCNIDMRQFTDVFRGAVEGNATFELTRAAEARREFIREAAE